IYYRCFPNTTVPTYSERLVQLKLQSIKQRFIENDLTLFHKIHHKVTNISERNLPSSLKHNYNTRNVNVTYRRLNARTNIRLNSYLIRTPKLFDKIPQHIKNDPLIDIRSALRKINTERLLQEP